MPALRPHAIRWFSARKRCWYAVAACTITYKHCMDTCLYCGQLKKSFTAGWPVVWTRKPASADRTARRQFQATGQPVSQTQASDAMTSRLPCYEAKCVQCRCFQWESVSLRSDIKGTELPPANILTPLERQLTALQLCCWQFLLWSPYAIGQTIIFSCCDLFFLFSPRLISAAADWMSAILPHMVWP